jgi:hypothetical protein
LRQRDSLRAPFARLLIRQGLMHLCIVLICYLTLFKVVVCPDERAREAFTSILEQLITTDSKSNHPLKLSLVDVITYGFGRLGAKHEVIRELPTMLLKTEITFPAPLVIDKDHRSHSSICLLRILAAIAM